MARIQPRRPRGWSIFLWLSYLFARWRTHRITNRRVAEAPEPFRLLGHRPLLMMAYGSFEAGLLWSRSLDPRVKELARARAGTLHGCPW